MREKEDEIERHEQSKDELKGDLGDFNTKLQDMEEELYGVRKQLLTTEQHMQKLLFAYIPKKGDIIEEALADFVNTYPEQEKMKILFLRESEGVYRFGQKRVFIKVEKGNNLKVRVGGGFMHINDFIEQYSMTEADKIERRDVISRFQNKLSIQKITSEQAIETFETSPVRSPQRVRSPGRLRSPGMRGSPKSGNRKSAMSPTKRLMMSQHSPGRSPGRSPRDRKSVV